MTREEKKAREEAFKVKKEHVSKLFDRYEQVCALRRVRDNPKSTPAQILEAVKLIEKL